MSINLAQADGSSSFTLLLLWTAAAIALLVQLRVFQGRSIMGPPRLKEDEPGGTLFLIFGAAFFTWIFVASALLRANHPAAPAATSPTTAPSNTTTRAPRELAIGMLVPPGAAMLVLIGCNLVFRRGGLKRLGLDPRRILPGIAQGFVGIFIALPLIAWISNITDIVWDRLRVWERLGVKREKAHEALRAIEHADAETMGMILASAILLAPLFEELMFRGHLQTLLVRLTAPLRRWRLGEPPVEVPPETDPLPAPGAPWRRWTAVIIASLLFAAVHEWWMTPPIFFLALCLGYAYERTGNLWVPITMHAAFNIWNSVLFLIMIRGGKM